MPKTVCDKCDGSGLIPLKDEYRNKEIGIHTVGDLKRVIKDMDDDAHVTYQRIEDVYFEKNGWKPELTVPNDAAHIYPDIPEDQYVTAFCSFKYEKDGRQFLCITAHY